MTTREIDERIAAALERVAKRFDWQPIAGFSTALHGAAAELRTAEPANGKCSRCGEIAVGRDGTGVDLCGNCWSQAAEPATRKPHESITPWPEQVSHEVPASEPVVAIGTNATGTNTPKSRDAGSIRATYTGVVSGDSGPVSRDTNGAAPPPSLVERLNEAAKKSDVPWALMREAADALEAAQAVNVAAEKVVESLKRARNWGDWTAVPHQIDALAATMERKP